MESAATSSEMDALKTKLRATWIAGDFGQIARYYTRDAEDFINRLNLKPGMKVLDVACGTGNLALPAARTGAEVTGVDIAPNSIEQARENAKREGLNAKFDEGDAEALPYADASFDAVVTMFGAMFAPRPELVAAELKRVCRPGGFIAMANWTPSGFIGQMFKTNAAYLPLPPGMASPVLWGVEETVRERFREGISKLETKLQNVKWVFPFSPAEVVEHFRLYYGPTQKAFGALDESKQAALRKDLDELWEKHNRATDGSTDVDAEYLEVIATRA
ncbi:MAG TPA: class I SAM-dependent methyltransferase [Pyrinomonadaceae bacterium]|jgi:2-polyprenyl-3-methyl-5-hydroxy-6-metoxy-1,4-benzoquinol methylase|nr:class I SAM-dependent methyltransferase [Pyrinomonadaceae bacterium]